MFAVFVSTVIVALLAAALQNAIFAAVSRVLCRSAQGIIGQNRPHRVTHKADLSTETFTLVALDEVMIHLVRTHHHARHCVLIFGTRAR